MLRRQRVGLGRSISLLGFAASYRPPDRRRVALIAQAAAYSPTPFISIEFHDLNLKCPRGPILAHAIDAQRFARRQRPALPDVESSNGETQRGGLADGDFNAHIGEKLGIGSVDGALLRLECGGTLQGGKPVHLIIAQITEKLAPKDPTPFFVRLEVYDLDENRRRIVIPVGRQLDCQSRPALESAR
jgi:hypothetical protein